MSSILKALKKLDAEKSARKPDSFKIDAEILRAETTARFSFLGIFLAAMLLFVCGGVATYLYIKPEKNEAISNQNTALPFAPAERITPETIVPATRIVKTKTSPDTSSISGSASSAGMKMQSGKHPDFNSALDKSFKPQPNVTAHQSTSTSGQLSAASKPEHVQNQPLLRVNGIAFQDGLENVAMINGVQVVKGSTIEGARVVDIQKDRVFFSFKGDNFEIVLGRSNR